MKVNHFKIHITILITNNEFLNLFDYVFYKKKISKSMTFIMSDQFKSPKKIKDKLKGE